RVGCMPSKVLIQSANDFYRRHALGTQGIFGGEQLRIDHSKVMRHVRSLRDRFTSGVIEAHAQWEDKLIRKRATLLSANTLRVGEEVIGFKKLIVATGSRPVLPSAWEPYKDKIIDTNAFFELETLPKRVAVIGLGVIGLELGQALHRLGVEVVGFTVGKALGGVSDPEIQDYIVDKLQQEFPLHCNGVEITGTSEAGQLILKADNKTYEVDHALVSVGRRANIDNIGLENLGVEIDTRKGPDVDINTMQWKTLPHIFFPGDVNSLRPILHEAADEGRIAGHNAVHDVACFKRRVSLGITFSDPNIATVGQRHQDLIEEKKKFVTGKVSFEGQGRSIVKLKEQGKLHVYADPESGEILGAELQAPDGEHLAHLLSWAVSLKLSVTEALKLPFYHPVIEEGLRTALRDAVGKLNSPPGDLELFRCEDSPIR
ncbi:MAG: dihydrolipoyl dehydrogenase, partial [Pseudomonadota bacterium]